MTTADLGAIAGCTVAEAVAETRSQMIQIRAHLQLGDEAYDAGWKVAAGEFTRSEVLDALFGWADYNGLDSYEERQWIADSIDRGIRHAMAGLPPTERTRKGA
jgi:hypothetical protein